MVKFLGFYQYEHTNICMEKIKSIENKRVFNPIVAINSHTNSVVTNPSNIAEILAEHYYNISKRSPNDSQFAESLNNTTGEFDENYNCPITIEELTAAIKSRRSSAPGPDDIHIDLIKHFAPTQLHFILRLFNLIWITHQLLSSWTTAHVIPILKPQKDHLDPVSYRPISLTSVMSKLMEKIITGRLHSILATRNLLDISLVLGQKDLQWIILSDCSKKLLMVFLRDNIQLACFSMSRRPSIGYLHL